MKNIVTKEWLLENISKNNLIILDARADLNDSDMGFRKFEEGHIKGAQFVSVEETMTGKIGVHGGRHPLPNLTIFVEDMKKLGISDNSTVVIYDDGDLAMAGRLWWLLKYIGKDQVFILEGGMNHWINNSLPITKDIIKPKLSNSLALNIDKSMISEMKDVKDAIESKDKVIVDSRAYERYSGEVEPLDKVPGHIPSAVNYPWTDLVKDGNIMGIEEIKKRFEPLEAYKEIIVHCGSGITGTVNLLFMEEIGLQPKLYPGGYSDWTSYDDNRIVKSKI